MFQDYGLRQTGQPLARAHYCVPRQVYFISFFFIGGYCLLALFTAVILDCFSVVNHQDSSAVNIDMLKRYKTIWARFDPYGAGYMDLHFLKRFVQVGRALLFVSRGLRITRIMCGVQSTYDPQQRRLSTVGQMWIVQHMDCTSHASYVVYNTCDPQQCRLGAGGHMHCTSHVSCDVQYM